MTDTHFSIVVIRFSIRYRRTDLHAHRCYLIATTLFELIVPLTIMIAYHIVALLVVALLIVLVDWLLMLIVRCCHGTGHALGEGSQIIGIRAPLTSRSTSGAPTLIIAYI